MIFDDDECIFRTIVIFKKPVMVTKKCRLRWSRRVESKDEAESAVMSMKVEGTRQWYDGDHLKEDI